MDVRSRGHDSRPRPDFDLVHLSEPRRLNPRLPWSHRLGIWQRR